MKSEKKTWLNNAEFQIFLFGAGFLFQMINFQQDGKFQNSLCIMFKVNLFYLNCFLLFGKSELHHPKEAKIENFAKYRPTDPLLFFLDSGNGFGKNYIH